MQNFRRVLSYVKSQWRAVVISMLCALAGAALMSVSLVTLMPLMKVIIEGQGLRSWAHGRMVKARCSVSFTEAPLDVTGQMPNQLEIKKTPKHGTAHDAGLKGLDTIQSLRLPDGQVVTGNHAMLAVLADPDLTGPIAMEVIHPNGDPGQLTMTLSTSWGYEFMASAIHKALKLLPADQASDTFKRDSIILIVMLLLCATILRCMFRFCQEYLVRRVSYRCIMGLRLDAFANVIRLPVDYFAVHGISDSMSRFVKDANQINQGISTVFGKGVREPFTMLCLAGAAFAINPKMTAIVLAGAPVAACVLAVLGRKMKKATKRQLESFSVMLARLRETLQGIRVVKGYHQEVHEDAAFRQVCQRLLRQEFRIAKVNAASGPAMEIMGITAICSGMIAAAFWLASNSMPGAEFWTVMIVLAAMAESGRKMGNIYPRLQQADAAAGRVFTMIDAAAESDPPNAVALGRLRDTLRFDHVSFTYTGATQKSLDDIDLSISAGQTVAVVGPNGSGKTTLMSLVPRFLVPDAGCVMIDGIDLATASLASLRQQIGLVTQQTITFHESIGANIAYGCPDATSGQIIEAAKRAYAHEFIEQTPKGYDTIVGELGVTLSGGQLQRIAIARAILRDPAILIFDEATSQIDADSEAKIQKAIAEFSQGRTSFIIAHRLSTIIDADRIIVLDAGRLAADGTHKELLESCTLYRRLYETQFNG